MDEDIAMQILASYPPVEEGINSMTSKPDRGVKFADQCAIVTCMLGHTSPPVQRNHQMVAKWVMDMLHTQNDGNNQELQTTYPLKRFGKSGVNRARMQQNAGNLAMLARQLQGHALSKLIECSLAGSVRVPAAQAIVRQASDPRRHVDNHGWSITAHDSA